MALLTQTNTTIKKGGNSGARIQRACSCGARSPGSGECESCRKKQLQRKAASGRAARPVASGFSADPRLISGGTPLPGTLRTQLEPLFASDFGRVRLHDDCVSHQATREVDAHAFTLGSHVHFARGQYRPDHPAGMHLLAHELTHTIQQNGASVAGNESVEVDAADSPREREADSFADHVTRELGSAAAARAADSPAQSTARPTVSRAPRARVQRAGFGEFLSRLFGEGTFSDKELNDYLKFLDDNAKIEGDYDSDNKAREIIRRWRADKSAYDLTLPRKQLLLLELIDGPTLDDDEHAILELLRGSDTEEIGLLIAAAGGEEELKGEFHGSESKELDALLARWRGEDVKAQPKRHVRPDKKTFAPNQIAEIHVNQTTPQTVIVRYGDNRTASDICSAGKGTCCVEPGSNQGPSEGATREPDSNWTPVGPHIVYKKQEKHGDIPWWMEFNTRAIALHEYSPVDGTPLSHGCVRLNASFAKKIFPDVVEHQTRVFVKDAPRPRCNHGPLQHEWEKDFAGAASKDGDPELIKHMHKALGTGKRFDEAMARKVIPTCPSRGRGGKP
jgi:lipoprotein-anchoring transpeptidase ErfK/SrfK